MVQGLPYENCSKEAGVRIIVVEGTKEMRQALAALLASPGRSVHAFENLCDAVRAMMREETHLLLLDLHQMALPCETTLSLLREVDPWLPVILTVADPESPEVARWARAGVFRVIAKPLDAGELLAAVEHAEAFARSARDSGARPAPKPSPA